jgi:hypothetical protein
MNLAYFKKIRPVFTNSTNPYQSSWIFSTTIQNKSLKIRTRKSQILKNPILKDWISGFVLEFFFKNVWFVSICPQILLLYIFIIGLLLFMKLFSNYLESKIRQKVCQNTGILGQRWTDNINWMIALADILFGWLRLTAKLSNVLWSTVGAAK